MNELNNKKLDELEGIGMDKEEIHIEFEDINVKPTTSISGLEAWIIAKSDAMNIPALAAYFGVGEDVIKQALTKK